MVGEFKDDQLQNHGHGGNVAVIAGPATVFAASTGNWMRGISDSERLVQSSYRRGDVTRGKRKGVKYIIKVL